MLSLIENNKDDFDKIRINIIGENISEEYSNKLNQIVEKYDNVEDVNIVPFNMNLDIPNLSIHKIIYAILYLAELLPDDKILCLDADTLILGSFKDLIENCNIDDYYFAAVADVPFPSMKKHLNLPEDAIYFNTGSMYVNLKMIRENNKLDCFIKNIPNYPLFPGQDLYNVCLQDKILKIPLEYNYYGYFFDLKPENVLKCFNCPYENFYTKEEIEKASNNIVLTHFLNLFSNVPWKDDKNPMYDKFKYYADLTPFSPDEIYEESNFTATNNFMHKIAKALPESISVIFCKRYLKRLDKKKFENLI